MFGVQCEERVVIGGGNGGEGGGGNSRESRSSVLMNINVVSGVPVFAALAH